MVNSIDELRSRLRTLTQYNPGVFSDSEFDEIIQIAEDEVRADSGDQSLTFYLGDESFSRDQALFWLSGLFAKIATGEIDGVEMSAGDLDISSLPAAESRWLRMYRRRIHQVGTTPGFGSVRVERGSDRTYSFDN